MGFVPLWSGVGCCGPYLVGRTGAGRQRRGSAMWARGWWSDRSSPSWIWLWLLPSPHLDPPRKSPLSPGGSGMACWVFVVPLLSPGLPPALPWPQVPVPLVCVGHNIKFCSCCGAISLDRSSVSQLDRFFRRVLHKCRAENPNQEVELKTQTRKLDP